MATGGTQIADDMKEPLGVGERETRRRLVHDEIRVCIERPRDGHSCCCAVDSERTGVCGSMSRPAQMGGSHRRYARGRAAAAARVCRLASENTLPGVRRVDDLEL
jgi:hypothetical protein